MPELEWDKLDFLECLEVAPEVEEYEVSYSYDVVRDGQRLLVIVWPYESLVSVSVGAEIGEEPMVELVVFVRGAVRYVHDKRGEYLEFNNTLTAPSGSPYQVFWDDFHPARFPIGPTLELRIKPHIQLRFV